MKRFTAILCGIAAATLMATSATAAPLELITNGNFESGSLSGWTVTNAVGGSGDFYFSTPGTPTPISGMPTLSTPANGIGYAVSDQPGPGVHALSQTFSLVASSSVILRFDMFSNDWDSGPICGPGLDIASGAVQCSRVDILTTGAGAFDTGAGVLANYFLGVDAGVDPNAFTSYLFDITSLVGGGGSFTLRFAEADNQFFYNMGVDNVSIVADSDATVPEPASFLLLGLGLAGIGAIRRSRR